jgi:predicted amidohydrolase YtcJ
MLGNLTKKALINGNVITMDPGLPHAQAILVLGNRIYDVGSNDRISSQLTPDTEVIDLAGRTVTPGFIDAHAHPLGYGLAQADVWVDCSDATCIDELVGKAEERAKRTPKGTWIFGRGWPASRLERWPTKQDFDDRVPDHPVWFNDLSGHLYILNSKGLTKAGITQSTNQPPNGRIDREASGDPTGIIRDCDPWDFADIPPFFTSEDIVTGLRTMMKKTVGD